jgi:hypothetical protein
VRDLVLLPLVALGLILQLLDPGLHEGVVVASVVLEVVFVQVNDLGADGVQKVLGKKSYLKVNSLGKILDLNYLRYLGKIRQKDI